MGGSRRAGSVHVEWSSNTAKVSTGLELVRKQSRETARQMKADIQEARGTIMVLGEEIGVHLPRHIQKFVAELPGVAPLLANAFATTAVVGLGMAVFESGKKIAELVEKTRAAGEAINSGFEDMRDKARLANDEMEVTNAKLDIQIAKLTGKHPNNLALELAEARVEAEKLYRSLKDAARETDSLLAKNEVGQWAGLITHTAATGYYKDLIQGQRSELDAIGDKYANLIDKATTKDEAQNLKLQERAELLKDEAAQLTVIQTLWNNLNHDRTAPGGTAAGNLDTVMGLVGGYGHLLQEQMRGQRAGFENQDKEAALPGAKHTADAAKKAVEEAKRLAKEYAEIWASDMRVSEMVTEGITATWMQGQREEEAGRKRAAQEERQAAQEYYELQRQKLEAALEEHKNERELATEAYQDVVEMSQLSVETGRETEAARIAELKTASQQEYQAKVASLNQELALYVEGTAGYKKVVNEKLRLDVEYGKQQAQLQRENMEQGLKGAFNDLIRRSQDYNSQLKEMLESTVNSVNDSLLKMMTSKYHKGDWKDAGKSIFSSVAKSGLQDAEGSLMKAFGLGGKPDGSQGKPLHVVVDGGVSSGVSGAGGGIGSLLGNSSDSGVASGAGSGVGSVLGGLVSALIPMASGGLMSPGSLYLTGENGPELMQVGNTSRISNARDTSSLLSGGGSGGDTHHHWNIDARGAADPSAVARQVNRAIMQAAPHIMGATIAAQKDMERRRPNMK